MNCSKKYNREIFEKLYNAKLQEKRDIDITFFEKIKFVKSNDGSYLPVDYGIIGCTFERNYDDILDDLREKNETFSISHGEIFLTTVTACTYTINLAAHTIEELETDLIDSGLLAINLPYFFEKSSELRDVRYIFKLLADYDNLLLTDMDVTSNNEEN